MKSKTNHTPRQLLTTSELAEYRAMCAHDDSTGYIIGCRPENADRFGELNRIIRERSAETTELATA